MANPSGQSHVYVGAARWRSGAVGGVFRRAVGDGGFQRLTKGLPEEINVQAITVHPTSPDVVYAGTDQGPFRSTDRGESWERLGFPNGATEVWSILAHPTNPRVMYAGTSPVGVFKSDDGGDHWRKLPDVRQPDRVRMEFTCRVMRLAIDPARPEEIYGALEVGGVTRSLDGGEHWEDMSGGLLDL